MTKKPYVWPHYEKNFKISKCKSRFFPANQAVQSINQNQWEKSHTFKLWAVQNRCLKYENVQFQYDNANSTNSSWSYPLLFCCLLKLTKSLRSEGGLWASTKASHMVRIHSPEYWCSHVSFLFLVVLDNQVQPVPSVQGIVDVIPHSCPWFPCTPDPPLVCS